MGRTLIHIKRIRRSWRSVSLWALVAASCGIALADEPAAVNPTVNLGTINVTATRTATPSFDTPASVNVIDGAEFHTDTLGVNLSEGLAGVPGLLARDRQNYAQDEQISARGFGARSAFGVRGVRLYLDGIPATQPDGQGQVSHFNLATADHVEVLRGPFSALYGNSSGGIIQMFTAPGRAPSSVEVGAAGGSYGTWRTDVGANGVGALAGQPFDYNVDYTHFKTDGFRQHSAARRDSFNGKLDLPFNKLGKLTLIVNSFSGPEAQDALGLTRVQFNADPRQATSVAAQFNTRKSAEQNQIGMIYELPLTDSQTIRVLGYYGDRQIRQFLSIPLATQANPLNPGGVVGLQTGYGGTDGRWTYRGAIAELPFTVVAGLSYDDLSQHRRGYENFIGTDLGVQGALRRDETDTVFNLDQYLQATLQFTPRWSLSAGVRHSEIHFDSHDHHVIPGQSDDSGSKPYHATTPVAGLMFKVNRDLHLYASWGEGFETPTLNELAYRPDGTPGLNFGLQSAHTASGELGAKLRLQEHIQAQIAIFDALTRRELVIDTNSNGRSTYQNSGRNRRQGIEAGLETQFAGDWHAQFAYTYLDATVRQAYLTCLTTPCATPTASVAAHNRIPGVPLSDIYAALRWGKPQGWQAEVNGRYVTNVPVNDTNTESTPSYALLGVDGAYVFDLPHWHIRTFVQLDNLVGQPYVGSVIVNDSNGRFYEPGPGRSALAGASFDWKY